jgi:serine/threonine protein kinase
VTRFATQDYIAPEMLKNEPYGESVDVWTIGILAYEFLTGRTPFRPAGKADRGAQDAVQRDLYAGIIKGRFSFPPQVSKHARSFISKVGTAST